MAKAKQNKEIDIIKMIDVFPGYKTYATMLVGLGMVVCQISGYHVFGQSEWAAVGITGSMFWKMGMDRGK